MLNAFCTLPRVVKEAMSAGCTIVSFVYQSVHALSENKLATAQTDEK